MKKVITLVMLLASLLSKAQSDGFTPVCVDSVWYDPGNPIIINVSVYNGSATNLNYPSVQIVDLNGDTIGNTGNYVTFFAQLNGTYTTYSDTITVGGITDFSSYTFVMNELFGASNFVMSFCSVTSVDAPQVVEFTLLQNPVIDFLYISKMPVKAGSFSIYNSNGAILLQGDLIGEDQSLDVSSFTSGIYFLRINDGFNSRAVRFIKM